MEVVSVGVLDLSTRAMHLLQRMKIHTVGEFIDVPIKEFSEQRGIGQKTIDEISGIQAKLISGELDVSKIESTDIIEQIDEEEVLSFSQEVMSQMALHPISELNLSVRSNNSMERGDIRAINQVMLLSDEDLIALPNLGKKSIDEIKAARRKWLEDNAILIDACDEAIVVPEKRRKFYLNLAELINPIIVIKWPVLYRLCTNNHIDEQIETDEIEFVTKYDFICLIENLEETRKGLVKYFQSCLPSNEDYVHKNVVIDKIEQDFDIDTLKSAIYDIFNYRGVLLKDEEYYMLRRQSLEDLISSMEITDKSQMLIDRFNGLGLQEIGDRIGVTRERVRQVTVKEIEKLPLVNEAYYAQIFTYFKFNKSLFYEVFQKSDQRTFEYLSIRYKKGEHELTRDEIEQYEGLYSSQLLNYIDRNDAVKWKRGLTRQKLAWRALVSNSGEYVSKDGFKEIYYSFLEKNDIDKKRFSYNPYTINNAFRNSNHVVFNRDGEFRYHENDTSEIWKGIDFRRYNNSVISSELIFRDYSENMEELDIWNGYELFCLLKNHVFKEEYDENQPNVVFRRIPVMIIGDGDESRQVVKFLKEVAPIEYWSFYEAYEERYGIRKETAIANLSAYIEQYYVGGEYIIDLPDLATVDADNVKNALATKDIWSIAELEQLFADICTHSEADALNGATLYQLGYSLNAGYGYNRSYGNVTDCFNHAIFNKDLVDLNDVNIEILRLSVFKSYIVKLRETLDYVEISPKLLASKAFLEREYGLDEGELYQIQIEASQYYGDKYFNGNSLWERIKNYPCVQKLKDNKWLCTSILRQQEGVFSLSIVNAVVLSTNRDDLSLVKICEWIIETEGRMRLEKLTERFNDLFGSKMDKNKLAFKIREQGNMVSLLTDSIEDYIEQLISLAGGNDDDDLFEEEFF
jgi:hypothetical protein